jgi:hypothetical protein
MEEATVQRRPIEADWDAIEQRSCAGRVYPVRWISTPDPVVAVLTHHATSVDIG